MNNCCGSNLRDGRCPKPGVMLLRQEDGTTAIVCAHPCARARMFLPQVLMSDHEGATLSVREAPSHMACMTLPDLPPLPTLRNGSLTSVEQIHDENSESDTLP